MRVLVTGGAGFIGSNVADAFLTRGDYVRVFDNLQPRVHPKGKPKYISDDIDFIVGDVRDKAALAKAMDGMDAVFHLAAYQDYMPDYSTFFHTNAVGTAMIFEIIREKNLNVQKVVLASSQAVYGEGQYECPEHGFCMPSGRTLKQLDVGDWNLRCPKCGQELKPILLTEEHTAPITAYGLSKICQEAALRLGRFLGIPTVALRYSITQGKRQSFYNAYSGICRIFTRALRAGQAPVVFEDGLQQRDYVHVDDVVNAHMIVLRDSRADYRAFNVGTAKPVTVLEYVKTLAETMGCQIEPQVPGYYRVGDVRHTVSSYDSLGELGWKPTKGLTEVFKDYLSWMSTMDDTSDYFTPALASMRQSGVVRSVHGRATTV